MTAKYRDLTPKGRRAYHYDQLRAKGHDASSAWNGARATIRFWDVMNADAIKQFVADCTADGVECTPAQAASILEDRWLSQQSV